MCQILQGLAIWASEWIIRQVYLEFVNYYLAVTCINTLKDSLVGLENRLSSRFIELTKDKRHGVAVT